MSTQNFEMTTETISIWSSKMKTKAALSTFLCFFALSAFLLPLGVQGQSTAGRIAFGFDAMGNKLYGDFRDMSTGKVTGGMKNVPGGFATTAQAFRDFLSHSVDGGKPLVIREGRRGPFVSCSGYPECRNTRNLPEGVIPGVTAASLSSHRLISNSAAIGTAVREPDPDGTQGYRERTSWLRISGSPAHLVLASLKNPRESAEWRAKRRTSCRCCTIRSSP